MFRFGPSIIDVGKGEVTGNLSHRSINREGLCQTTFTYVTIIFSGCWNGGGRNPRIPQKRDGQHHPRIR